MICFRDPKYIKATAITTEIVGEWIHRSQIETFHVTISQTTGVSQGLFSVDVTNDPAKDEVITISQFGIAGGMQSFSEGSVSLRPEWWRLRYHPNNPGETPLPDLTVRVIGRDR